MYYAPITRKFKIDDVLYCEEFGGRIIIVNTTLTDYISCDIDDSEMKYQDPIYFIEIFYKLDVEYMKKKQWEDEMRDIINET